MQTILDNIDAELLFASDAFSGLDIFNQQHPQIIITDLQLPGMSGIDFIREIHRIEAISGEKKATIIVLTGHSSDEVEALCCEVGIDEFVSKPLVVNDFIQLILKYLN